MNRRTLIVFSASLLAFAGMAQATIVTNPNDPRNWQGATVGTFAQLYFGADTPTNRQQVVDQQLLDDGIFDAPGYLAASLLPTAWTTNPAGRGGTSTDLAGAGDYTYTFGTTDLFTAANTIDNTWFQSSGVIGDTVFDFGGAVTSAAVFPVIDHGPLPVESIESTVYLSNDLVNWSQAHVARVFLEGFQPNLGIKWDGFTYVVTTQGSSQFRYASIIHGGPGGLVDDGDDEINGMMGFNGIPAPGAAGLLGLGSVLALRRRRDR